MTTPMTKEAAARIQSATAKANNGIVPKDSFAATAMSIAAKAEIVKPIPQTKAIAQPKNMTSNKQMSSNQQEDNWPSKVPNHDSGKRRTNNPPKRK